MKNLFLINYKYYIQFYFIVIRADKTKLEATFCSKFSLKVKVLQLLLLFNAETNNFIAKTHAEKKKCILMNFKTYFSFRIYVFVMYTDIFGFALKMIFFKVQATGWS